MERHPHVIETARLVGRAPEAQDFGSLRLLHADPRVMRTLSTNTLPLPEPWSRRALQAIVEHFRRHGYGAWFFHERAGGDFVGYCGLKHSLVEGAPVVELLYSTRSAHWWKGYTAEAAAACLAFGFDALGLEEIVAFTLPHNRGSRAVMEGRGFVYMRPVVHAGLPHLLYRLRKPVSPPAPRRQGTGGRSGARAGA